MDGSTRRVPVFRLAGFGLTLVATTLLTVALVAPPALATFPGLNGRIAFSLDRGAGSEIYSMGRNGAGIHRLTNLDGDAKYPDWSPDGKRIVFWLLDTALYVMRADGSHLHTVTMPGGRAAFTPDGHHLVYASGDGVFLMRADGSDAPGRRLTSNPFPHQGDDGAQVSPDGRTVAFARIKRGDRLQGLYSVRTNGRHEQKLLSYRREISPKLDWSPDGTHILITEYADHPDGHTPNVAVVRADGSGLVQLTHLQGPDVGAFAGSYSPDGRWIVYRRENTKLGKLVLFKVHEDGSGKTRIKSLRFAATGSDWGPRPG